MKTSLSLLANLFCLLIAVPVSAEELPYRLWRNAEGKRFKARLLSVDGDAVTMMGSDGRLFRNVKLELFSEEDRAYVRALGEEKAARAAEALRRPRTQPCLALPGDVLFEDRFDSASGGWRMSHGSWQMEGGVLTAQEREEDQHAAVMKQATPLKDVVVEFEVKLSGTAKQACFGFDDTDHICRFQMTPKFFLVKKDDHDHDGPDEGVLLQKKDLTVSAEDWSLVRLEVVGPHFLAEVSGQVACGSHELIASEKTRWGFVVGGGPVQFRGLRIWAAEPVADLDDVVKRLTQGQ